MIYNFNSCTCSTKLFSMFYGQSMDLLFIKHIYSNNFNTFIFMWNVIVSLNLYFLNFYSEHFVIAIAK